MNRDETPSPATSVDVARRAGVSQSAVSLVFAGKAEGRVGKQTQEAIRRAARDLAYHPNRAARTLRSGRCRLLVMAVPDVSNPYFAAVLKGAEQAARQRGYSVMLASVRDEADWQQVILDPLAARAVDGFLLFALIPPTEDVDRTLIGKAVLVDASSQSLPCLRLNVGDGMQAAVSHLLRLGHARIAHLAAAVDAETFDLRRQAYEETLRAAGLPLAATHQERAAFTIDDAQEAARRILERPDPPSAIVCDSDVLAVGVYKAARALRRAIPRDLSVVGFDDGLIARILDPELTTLAIPTAAIGEQAVQLLLAVLEGGQMPPSVTVPLELVIRSSSTRATPSRAGGETTCAATS